MKIKLGTLRKIISEEISRNLTEAVSIEQIESVPIYHSWFSKQVMKNDAAANAWDDMLAAAASGVFDRNEANTIGTNYGIDPLAVSFHLRQLVKDPGVKKGTAPTGADLLALAAEQKAVRASMPKPAAAPGKEFDPYERSPQLVGSSGRYVGD